MMLSLNPMIPVEALAAEGLRRLGVPAADLRLGSFAPSADVATAAGLILADAAAWAGHPVLAWRDDAGHASIRIPQDRAELVALAADTDGPTVEGEYANALLVPAGDGVPRAARWDCTSRHTRFLAAIDGIRAWLVAHPERVGPSLEGEPCRDAPIIGWAEHHIPPRALHPGGGFTRPAVDWLAWRALTSRAYEWRDTTLRYAVDGRWWTSRRVKTTKYDWTIASGEPELVTDAA